MISPELGFLMVSTSPLGIPTVIFGILPIPHALGPNAFLEEIFKELHQVLGYLLALLLLLHAGAALKHHFYNRDPVLRRMIGGERPSYLEAVKGEATVNGVHRHTRTSHASGGHAGGDEGESRV